eukprot:jgi/Ulvmu1/9748/UM055_0088.1
MLAKPCAAAAAAICVAALLQEASAFQIWMNMNQFPDVLNRRPEDWAEAKALVEGLVGPAAPHPTDPMPNSKADGFVRAEFIKSFADIDRVLTQKWSSWEPTNGAGIFEKFTENGFDVDEVFLWSPSSSTGPELRMTLAPSQLDQLAKSPETDEALILVKSFGKKLADKDRITASIDHPACSGVVMEIAAELWCETVAFEPRLTAAKYVAASGKRLFVMPPPRSVDTTPLPDQMDCMMDALFEGLGAAFVCSHMLRIVPAAYGASDLVFLPERTPDGDIAPTYMGSILMLQAKRDELCGQVMGVDLVLEPTPKPTPEPMPEPTPEPTPEPEEDVPDGDVDGDDESEEEEDDGKDEKAKGKVKHSSGLTAREMADRIRKQRKASMGGKLPMTTRTVRGPRRHRGVWRGVPRVADVVVAVDEDGEAVVESDEAGVSIEVSSSTSEGW